MPEETGRPQPRFDVTSVGESMLRLSVGTGRRLASTNSLDVHVAGAESNVCAALAGLGRRTGWVSRLPDNPLGQLVLRRAREWGVDVSSVVITPEGRLGTYYIELAAPPLPTRVTYDRSGSAFTAISPSEVDWNYLLDTSILHLSGITPALSRSCRVLMTEAVDRAKERGVTVSLDVNYRGKLWSPRQAAESLTPLLTKVDVLFCGQEDAVRVFGLPPGDDEVLDGLARLTSARHVVVSLGAQGAVARSAGRTLRQEAMPVTVVDGIGAGDAFAAGVLDGLLDADLEKGLATGAVLAALALSQHGDVVTAGRAEVEEFASGSAGLEVLR